MGMRGIAVPVSLFPCRRAGGLLPYPGTGYSGYCLHAGRAYRKGISLGAQREPPGVMRIHESLSGKVLRLNLAQNQGRR